METQAHLPTQARRIPLLIIGVALVIWGQVSLITNYFDLRAGLVPTALGLVVAGYVWLRRSPAANAPPKAPNPNEAPRARLSLPGIELFALAAVLAVILSLRADREAAGGVAGYAEMFILWGLSIACFVMGTLQTDEISARWKQLVRDFRAEPRQWAMVLALTVLALWVRITALEIAPMPFSFDEGSFAQEAAAIAEGRFLASPFEPAWLSHPRLFFCIVALGVKAFGRTVLAARLVPAIFGALGVPAVYMLGRRIFGRRVGLAAAIFLTGFHIHLHFSRLALNNIVDPLWATLAFSLLLRGFETGRLSDFGLSGLALGMAQYGYAAARLLPVIMAAFLVIVLILRPRLFRHRLLHLFVLVLGVVIITWPSDWFYISQAYPLTTRLSATGLFETGRFDVMRATMSVGEIAFEQIKWAWLALIHTYDRSGFYGAITPVMGQFAGGLFLLGAAYSLLRLPRLIKAGIRRDRRITDTPASLLPMLWITATIFAGSALLIDPPQFPRYVLLLPAAALLVGLGVVETLDLLVPFAPKVGQWAAVAISVALMTADVVYYFDIYLHNPTYASNYNTLMGDAVARFLRDETGENPNLNVYYLTGPRVFLDHSTLVQYFAPDVFDRDLLGGFTELPEEFNPYADNLFILGVDSFRDLELLTLAAPGGTIGEHWSRFGELLFISYRVPAANVGIESRDSHVP